MEKSKHYKMGLEAAHGTIKYIEDTIFKNVQNALKDAEKQLKVKGMNENNLNFEHARIKVYKEYIESLPYLIKIEDVQHYDSYKVGPINKAIINGVSYSWMSPRTKGDKCGWVKD